MKIRQAIERKIKAKKLLAQSSAVFPFFVTFFLMK